MTRLEVWNLGRGIMRSRCEERGVGIPLWGACARGVSFRRRGDQLHYWEMLLFYMLIDGGLIALRSLADQFRRYHDSNGRQEFIGFDGSGSCSLAHEGCFVSTAALISSRLIFRTRGSMGQRQ